MTKVKKVKPKEGGESFHLRLPTKLWAQLQVKAVQEQRTMANLMRKVLAAYCDGGEGGTA